MLPRLVHLARHPGASGGFFGAPLYVCVYYSVLLLATLHTNIVLSLLQAGQAGLIPTARTPTDIVLQRSSQLLCCVTDVTFNLQDCHGI